MMDNVGDEESNACTTLLNMGFSDLQKIKRAVRSSRNDINDAISILTRESPSLDYLDDKSLDAPKQSNSQLLPLPSYKKVTEDERNCSMGGSSQILEFPAENLYELSARVYPDNWSIPYKKEESLGKCLISATHLANEGLCEADENCKKFMDGCMPEAFKKLLTTGAVRSWGMDVQEGVYNMLNLLIDLVVARLKYEPVPEHLLSNVLAMAFDPETEFHIKNKIRRLSSTHAIMNFDPDKAFAASSSTSSSELYVWLVNLINKFGFAGGFDEVHKHFLNENLPGSAMLALLVPFSKSVDFLIPDTVSPIIAPCLHRAVEYVKSLTEADLKNKNIGTVTELLKVLKILSSHLSPLEDPDMTALRLDVILRMLKCAHFNARMNGLKEVVRLIEDCNSVRSSRLAVESDKLLDWLAENRVLSIALEGNIDQVQYAEKIKGIIEFLGPKLSIDELTKIWSMQDDQNCQIQDNIHSVMAAASGKFNNQQFDHLLSLIQKSWEDGNEQTWRRLLTFTGRIGKETSQGKATTKVLDLLWEMAHLPYLSPPLVEHALEEHLCILGEVPHKDITKKNFLLKCVEDIKKETCVLPSLKFLHNLGSMLVKSAGVYKQDKAAIHDLNKAHDIVKLVTLSIMKYHKYAVTTVAEANKPLLPSSLIDGRYHHEEYIMAHLDFLQFLLQEGSQYLPWNRTKEIWDTLVTNPDACECDRELCFEWFKRSMMDLEMETQSCLFLQKLLKLDPAHISYNGFECFQQYFESINTSENKLRRSGQYTQTVEKLDLTGVDFLWMIALSAQKDDIANMATDIILKISYHGLSIKLKSDLVALHNRFIAECYKRLEYFVMGLGVSDVSTAVSNATKTLTAISVAEVAAIHPPNRAAQLQSVRRILLIAERYISTIEEIHTAPRTILPHGASFLGTPMVLKIIHETAITKEEFLVMSHSNECLRTVRQRIANYFQVSVEQIQLCLNESVVLTSKDQKLIKDLELPDNNQLSLKLLPCSLPVVVSSQNDSSPGDSSSSSSSSVQPIAASSHQSFLFEQEKLLPGVVMSNGDNVFDMLYKLTAYDDSRITYRIRSLLHLIPTDPSVLNALESVALKTPHEPTPIPETHLKSSRNSPKRSVFFLPKEKPDGPKDVLRKLFDVTLPDKPTPFRLLYNLEVLSGKLIPTIQDAATVQSAQAFCEDFLSSGGLKLILGILQRDSLPQDTEYKIRHGCYYVAMQIASYLLSGLPVTSYFKPNILHINNPHSKPKEIPMLTEFVRKPAIKLMSNLEVLDVVQSLVRVTWAAAAGQLQLANSVLPTKESFSSGHLSLGGRRSRQSSTGSTASSSSDGETQGLHSGVCVQQNSVSVLDSQLAQEMLAFIVSCIELREDTFSLFSTIPCIGDFIIEVLLGSHSESIRHTALIQFIRLSCVRVQNHLPNNHPPIIPKHFLLQALLKVPLPLWIPSSSTRGGNQRLLSQCKEYFELGCHLLNELTTEDQQVLRIKPKEMIEDEMNWIQGFSPSNSLALQPADNALLTGHFSLIKTLLTCEGVEKLDVGSTLIPHVLTQFLFPASHLINEGIGHNTDAIMQHLTNRCVGQESSIAAFLVLVELATNCADNLEIIVNKLISMHHTSKPLLAKEYEYEPLVAERANCGYVGLKNAGATCYMNSVIQQLYMQPGVREAILAIDENDLDEESLFYQIQLTFGHLFESHLQYHIPEKFWKCFRLWGQPINVREQQDAFEFFTHLVDQVDEYLKSINREPLFQYKYGGVFSDQKICNGCPHRYEREELFIALNLPVKSHDLKESLDQFVKGELLEGDNAYFCEECHEKRNTVKRTCIKTLPPVLVMQLKRFDYDWEANRALKFDDYFKFPWVLDMSPYKSDGFQENDSRKSTNSVDSSASPGSNASKSVLYELVGIVVHSGQASAGHYYSYIKERRSEGIPEGNKSKWFKFNDTTVEEVEMTEQMLEAECFGGTYKAKSDSNSSYPETRQRYWNAYMLFYESLEEPKTPRTPRKTPNKLNFRRTESGRTPKKSNSGGNVKQRDSLSQLTQLVDRGEKHGIFVDKMPGRIQRSVQEENLRFMNNRDVYNDNYFTFIQNLVAANIYNQNSQDYARLMVESLKLSVNFLFNTYLRYKRKSTVTLNEWVDTFESILSSCEEATNWLLNYFASDEGLSLLKPFLLECPNQEVRKMFASIIEKNIINFFRHGGKPSSPACDVIIDRLIDMLDSEVANHCRSCSQYFELLSAYSQVNTSTCEHLIHKSTFTKLLVYLLGSNAANMNSNEIFPCRWRPGQSRDMVHVHKTMAMLILCCEMEPHRTCDPEDYEVCVTQWVPGPDFISMPEEIRQALYGLGSFRYVQEVVNTFREASGPVSIFVDMLMQCSFCNAQFTSILIKQVMLQYSSVPSNELKNLSHLLLELLTLKDPLQEMRLKYVICGFSDENETPIEGLFSIINENQHNDSRRSYQGVKFLVMLSHRCNLAKEILMHQPARWQWAVDWLKKEMSPTFYMNHPAASMSNEDSNTKTFQRTVSAQETLTEATALLTELESPEAVEAMDLDDGIDCSAESAKESDDLNAINSEEMTQDNDSELLKRTHRTDDLVGDLGSV